MSDVRQDQYLTVIREMIRHENDVTNHRIMWLLVGQGFVINAYVSAKNEVAPTHAALSLVGILVSLSAFMMLYQSYEALGYLQFLGLRAKEGTLREVHLPLMGWPKNRIEGWWKSVWVFPWFRKSRDLMEPWVLLPFLFSSMWMAALLSQNSRKACVKRGSANFDQWRNVGSPLVSQGKPIHHHVHAGSHPNLKILELHVALKTSF